MELCLDQSKVSGWVGERLGEEVGLVGRVYVGGKENEGIGILGYCGECVCSKRQEKKKGLGEAGCVAGAKDMTGMS